MDETRTFAPIDKNAEMKEVMKTVYEALKVKGYNPTGQIVGYILSEDPTYITSFMGARGLITRLDRDDLLREMVKSYIDNL